MDTKLSKPDNSWQTFKELQKNLKIIVWKTVHIKIYNLIMDNSDRI